MHPHHQNTPDRAKAAKRMYAHGGRVHDDEKQDKKLIKKMLVEHDEHEGEKVGGKKAKVRLDKRARGGRVKGKPHTTVNVVVGHGQPGSTPVPVPVPVGGASPMNAGPQAAPPHPMAPQMPPQIGAGLPGTNPMMRKHGGRVPHVGEANRRTEEMRRKMSNKKQFSSGGRVHTYPKMDAGAASGEGRIEKIEKYGKKAR